MFDLTPFDRNERKLMNLFDRFDRDFFGNFDQSLAAFRTDIVDKGDHYELEADLPGFAKEDIHIDVDGDCLTIHAEHNEESETKEKKNFVRRERHYGSYARSFQISDVECSAIKASYKNGVLKLQMPKRKDEKRNGHSIDID